MELTVEQNKLLVERFPFLKPRNVWTGEFSEDYDYSYIVGVGDVPRGWERLFLLYCKHLRETLVETNFLE